MRNKVRSVGRVVLIVSALAGLLGPVADLTLPQPVLGSPAAPLELLPRAYLPMVSQPEAPVVPDLAIYDKYSTLQDWDWLVATFGPVTLDAGTGAAQVIELREAGPYVTLLVRVETGQGDPIVGQEVVFYWPDAPLLSADKQACGLDRGLVVLTKDNGNAEFAMGTGSMYYPDQGVAGPHVVWVVREGSDCLRGLGWIAGTDHTHLDSVWRLP
jgi:hypothetical protein